MKKKCWDFFFYQFENIDFLHKKKQKKDNKKQKKSFFSHDFKNKRSQSWKRLTISKENTLSIGFGPNSFFFCLQRPLNTILVFP